MLESQDRFEVLEDFLALLALQVFLKASLPPASTKYEIAKKKQMIETISAVIRNPTASVTKDPYAGAIT